MNDILISAGFCQGLFQDSEIAYLRSIQGEMPGFIRILAGIPEQAKVDLRWAG
jgi:hypothetical protein